MYSDFYANRGGESLIGGNTSWAYLEKYRLKKEKEQTRITRRSMEGDGWGRGSNALEITQANIRHFP